MPSGVRETAFALALAAGLAAGPASGADAPTQVPVPDGYRIGDYRAPTPAELPGATTVAAAAARALVMEGKAIPINVLKAERSTLPGTPWLVAEPVDMIPGGVWLPNVGTGSLKPDMAAYFAANLERATGGDRGRGVMFYCRPQCWMSWNAGKRALEMGYTQVYWYPGGIEGWTEAGLPVETGAPVPFDPPPGR